MRIVSGDLKGREIVAPKGQATRPTSDRARETLFNILAHADYAPALNGARILDLFAGSGALGFEALSRGADFCLFVETQTAARRVIQSNIAALKQAETSQLYRRSAVDLGTRSSGIGAPFSIAFLDPPYGKGLVQPCLASLARGEWLSDDALVVAETATDEEPSLNGWEGVNQRIIGAAKFWFLKRNSGV